MFKKSYHLWLPEGEAKTWQKISSGILYSEDYLHNDNNMIASLQYLVGGFNPSEKYEFVSKDYPNWLRKIKNVPNHQPGIYQYTLW